MYSLSVYGMEYILSVIFINVWFSVFADDAHSVELTHFKEQFKSHLSELARPVSQIFLLTHVLHMNLTNFMAVYVFLH